MEQVGENMYNFKNNIFINCDQTFYLINKDGFECLKKLHQLDEVYINETLINKIDILLQFVSNHKGFCCGITKAKIGKEKYFFLPMLFYKKCSEWIRVRIETTKCSACSWQGNIANPTLPDLYEVLDNKFELMKNAMQIETVPCPKCNKMLKRHAIWVETDNK